MTMMAIKCDACGKFMSYKDLNEGHFHFIPLNEFGPEEMSWTHRKCYNGEQNVSANRTKSNR
jgi:hypothetical protein